MFLYLFAGLMLFFLPLERWIKLLLILSLGLFLWYELLIINLKFKKSILAIRLQDDCWQIKRQNSWSKVKLVKSIFIADILLLLVFNAKGQIYRAAISQDMLGEEMFRKLRVSVKVHNG